MPPTIIRLEPSKRLKRVRVVNDAIPGILLLITGLTTVSNQGFNQSVMAYLSIVVGIVSIRFAVQELKHSESHGTMSWFDISGGCVILIDALNQYKPYKGFQPAHLLILAGIVTVIKGMFGDKWPTVRRVELSDEGLYARTHRFRSIKFHWKDLRKIQRTSSKLIFYHGQKISKLRLRLMENRKEVIDSIVEAVTTQGIQIEDVS